MLLPLFILSAAAICLLIALKRSHARSPSPTAPPCSVSPAPAPPADPHGRPGWLKVLRAAELLSLVQADETLTQLLRQSRLDPPAWQRDLLPALHRYAEFVQLMPASESHHHAHAGGLLSHTLETLLAAMTWRNGRLLPQGACAEDVDAQRDFWTYAVFFAALLHDVGKPLTDLRIDWSRPGSADPLRWMPVAGSLIDCQAEQYRVGFAPKAERDYAAHSRTAVTLLQRMAPPSALSFLARQPSALHALTRFLSGEERGGSIADIVKRADQASTSRALALGSRARFPAATSVPLVELLMSALKDLLRQGGRMPLNRDGAIGWVHDGSVWFVAKRVADEVRRHLAQHAPDEAVPGDSKNDRLFDTWQEYACIVPNPQTQQAIWYVVVHGEDGGGYRHRLTMLRFALDKLWDDPAQYPAPMAGRIEVLPGRAAEAESDQPQELSQPLPVSVGEPAAKGTAPGAVAAEGKSADAVAVPSVSTAEAAPAVRAPSFNAPKRRPNAAPAEARKSAKVALDQSAPKPAAEEPADDGLLDEADGAAMEARKTMAERRSATKSPPSPTASTGPVVLMPNLPALPDEGENPASETAERFRQWLLDGLATRSIRYNETGALVHFVPAGMALVSPLIFREFAREHSNGEVSHVAPDKLGLDVQREVVRAGWHVPAVGGNIHSFTVVKRGGVRSVKLSAVVLAHPERWVAPVPPVNPALAPAETAQAS